MRPDAGMKGLQPRSGNRRRKCTVAEVEIPSDGCCPQCRVAEAPSEFAPITVSAEQRLERKERRGYRKHNRKDCQQTLNVREPLEQRGSRIKQDHHDEQYGFERPCDLGDVCGELADLPRARQGEKKGERVDRKQDARYHAQIAEVRQGVGQVVLPYTLHFCADAKVDACGDEPRASRLRCILQATMAAKPKPGKKLWSGRFAEPVSELVMRYTASVRFDRRLAAHDIRASLAHARMLRAVRILTATDLKAIERGLSRISREIEAGRFRWSLAAEDVHVNIERRLIALVGEAGKRLHTARSRNDQVATDLRLWLRDAIDEIGDLLRNVQRRLLDQAEKHAATLMPGFTHLQVAQPVTFGHHLLAYFEMLERDRSRLADCRRRVNHLPLGAAALAGTSFRIDRAKVARELGFDAVSGNSLDAVSDRDFAIEFCACAALTMVHLSRLSEELILWANPRFGFVALPDRFCTGSSIMPQKKNPDVPELARGKTGRVAGDLMALLTVMKGQPLAYNKDNQEDKEPLFDAADTLRDTLAVFAELIAGLRVDAAAMRAAAEEGFATATDLADYLVRKGIAFRDAHEAVARAVRFAEESGRGLQQLTLEELRRFSAGVESDVQRVLTLEGSVASRSHVGGTAPAQVRAAIRRARKTLKS